jgi:hypothetical protein
LPQHGDEPLLVNGLLFLGERHCSAEYLV